MACFPGISRCCPLDVALLSNFDSVLQIQLSSLKFCLIYNCLNEDMPVLDWLNGIFIRLDSKHSTVDG